MKGFPRDRQYKKFALYGLLKNLRFFDPFIILFFRESGLSFTQIGFLISFKSIAINVLEIPSGIFADSVGRRISMILSFMAYILSFLIFFFYTNFFIYLFAMLFFAFGEAFRTGTHKAMILAYLKNHNLLMYKIDYYGHTRSWSQRGSAISSLLAAILVYYTGEYRYIFLWSILPYVIDLFLMISYPKELDFTQGRIFQENKNLHDKNKHALRHKMVVFKEVYYSFIKMFKLSSVRIAVISTSSFSAFFKTIKDYIQPIIAQSALVLPLLYFIDEVKRPTILIGLVYSVLFLITSYASRKSSQVQKLIGSSRAGLNILFISGAFATVLIGVFVKIEQSGISILLFIILYIIMNIRKPLGVDYISDNFEDTSMSTALSAESQFETLLATVLAPVLGFFIDILGLGSAIALYGFIMLLCSVFVWIPQKRGKKAS